MPITDPDWVPGTATGTLPWDIPGDVDGGPRRGGPTDYGATLSGPALEDEEGSEPPKDGKHLYADMMNAALAAIIAAERVHFAVGFTVTLDLSGNPVLSKVTGMPAVATLTSSKFGLNVTATGNVVIVWHEQTLPPSILEPSATLNSANDGTFGGGINAQMLPDGLGVRVLTWTGASTPAFRPFTVLVW